LRGNQRKSGEQSKREGGKIFGSGSRAPIAITLFIKNPKASNHGQIYIHDIGDYLSREEKLEKISRYTSIYGIDEISGWQSIVPNEHGDWISQRLDDFNGFYLLGDKGKASKEAIFSTYSIGVLTNRDTWVYNQSETELRKSVSSMLDFYNKEQGRLSGLPETDVLNRLDRDKSKIKWTSDVEARLAKGKDSGSNNGSFGFSLHRPFTKTWHYSSSVWNWSRHLMPKYFPIPSSNNNLICISGIGGAHGFFCVDVQYIA
jgi:predicted helicase